MSAGPKRRATVLVLSSTYPRWKGDPEPGFVHELCSRLAQHCRIIVLCPHAQDAENRETMDGVEVVRYRYAPARFETLVNDGGIVSNLWRKKWKWSLVPGFLLAQAWVMWRLIRREKVDLIHAHWLLPQGMIAALVQYLPGCKVPFVVTSHGADLYALRGKLLDMLKVFVARRAATTAVVSSAMRGRLQTLGVPMDRVFVMPMGVDLNGRFTPALTIPRSRREILFVGRLVEKKGLRYLLDAMPSVLREAPDALLTVVGFGPEAPSLKAQAASLGLGARVRFLGGVAQAQLPSYYQRATLTVAPFTQAESGDQEGLGLVLVEAIGCGCPVVASYLPAMDDVLDSKFCGQMLVPPADVEALSRAILRVFNDPERACKEIMDVRDSVQNRFDWESVRYRYSALFEEVLH